MTPSRPRQAAPGFSVVALFLLGVRGAALGGGGMALGIGGAALGVGAAGCVSQGEAEGAPCPCPESLLCCITLSACVVSPEDCPDHYPASSTKNCRRDDQCPLHEVCFSWTGEGQQAAGFGQCRRQCQTGFPCATGETCQLVPHDDQPLEDFSVTRACVPQISSESCGADQCGQCEKEELGRRFCKGDTVAGCLISLDSACGLTCQLVSLDTCLPGGCQDRATGPVCEGHFGPDPCLEFPCSACETVAPSQTACVGEKLVRCPSLPYPGELCDRICAPVEVSCPEGRSCSEDPTPRCTP